MSSKIRGELAPRSDQAIGGWAYHKISFLRRMYSSTGKFQAISAKNLTRVSENAAEGRTRAGDNCIERTEEIRKRDLITYS